MADLVWSIKNGELDRVQEELENLDIDVNSEVNGRYLLHYAADFGQSQVLSYLIEKGARVDLMDKHGITPLLAAIWEGHTECVKILLQKGASKSGFTPSGIPYVETAEKEDIKALLQ